MTTGGVSKQSRTIKASEFKAHCLRIMDEVADGAGEIVITKRGKPVAKLTAHRERPKMLFVDDTERFPFLKEVSEAFDRGERAEVVFEAELGLIDGKPCCGSLTRLDARV